MMVAELPKAKRKRSRQQRRASVTYHKLLNAARDVFSEKGMDLTRIDEITERADVGKGTFYYHFQSKEELIRELIKSVLGELEMAVEEKCRGMSDLTGLVDTLIGAHIEFFSKRWEDFVLYFQGRAELNLQETYQGIDTPFLAYLKRIEDLIASVTRYRLPRPVLTRIACAAAGFVSGYYSFAVVTQGEDEDVDETLRSLRGAMVSSLVRFITEAMPPGPPESDSAIETTGSGAVPSEGGAAQ